MATLIWPDGLLPSTFDWFLNSNGTSFQSPWNGQTQTARFPGSSWTASMTLSNLDDYESRALEVLLVELDGISGRVQLYDFGRAPRVAQGTPVVMGAAQVGNQLVTNGWTPNMAVFKKGDYFTVNNELKMVLSDASADGTGKATVRFGPQLRTSPANKAPLVLSRPYGIFRLEQGKNGVNRKPGITNDFTLNFVEAF